MQHDPGPPAGFQFGGARLGYLDSVGRILKMLQHLPERGNFIFESSHPDRQFAIARRGGIHGNRGFERDTGFAVINPCQL